METLRIDYNKSIKEKLLEFLATFPAKDLEIVPEDEAFIKARKEVLEDYKYAKSKGAEFFTVNEVREMLNKKENG